MIRRCSDIDILLRWRREVIFEVFGQSPSESLMAANEHYYRQHIADGSHLAYIVSVGDTEVGCGSICLSDELPSPDNPSGKCAYLMNIYIRPAYRNEGHAHMLVRHLVEEAIKLGCGKIYLESTEMAKPLYSDNGFVDMENMMKYAETDVKDR